MFIVMSQSIIGDAQEQPYNEFERTFFEFLNRCSDVLRFASLGTTEQDSSGATFRVDYIRQSSPIGLYSPDWIVVQETDVGILNWIIETKGPVCDGTNEKDLAIQEWCQQLSIKTGKSWRYLRVNQSEFSPKFDTFRALSVSLIANALFRHRATHSKVVTDQWIREAREDGRL